MLAAVKLGIALYNGGGKNRKELIEEFRKAITDDYKISVSQWATIGKQLGVFDTKSRKEA